MKLKSSIPLLSLMNSVSSLLVVLLLMLLLLLSRGA